VTDPEAGGAGLMLLGLMAVAWLRRRTWPSRAAPARFPTPDSVARQTRPGARGRV